MLIIQKDEECTYFINKDLQILFYLVRANESFIFNTLCNILFIYSLYCALSTSRAWLQVRSCLCLFALHEICSACVFYDNYNYDYYLLYTSLYDFTLIY